MKILGFRDLEVWRLGKDIALIVYTSTADFPHREMYGFVAEMRRSAVSIPCNVAEGFNRFHNKEYRHFLYVALGSCGELETQVELSSDLGYLAIEYRQRLLEKLDHESRMLRNLVKKLTSSTS
jgi:four helix bundle protein